MNPTSNPNPMPSADGATGATLNPVNPEGMPSAAPETMTNPVINPTPVEPAPVVPVEVAPTAPVVSVETAAPTVAAPVAPMAAENPVINPVINPASAATPGVAPMAGGFNATTADGASIFDNTATNPVGGAAGNPVFDPTAPLMVPEPVAPPDPVEEELKAPMQAAGPVPGSIGSAISMLENGVAEGAGIPPVGGAPQQTPNVSFSDPATEANAATNPMAANPAVPAKKKLNFSFDLKKMDKKNLIMLCVVAGIVVVALVAVLIMLATGML